ncbi:MAG TPA: hypothetical protein IAB70_02215, partial [Candidatus Merdicola faecigallinarum]|nr:hypothetical protein [Candidatus Merdicola faecigallinarum]
SRRDKEENCSEKITYVEAGILEKVKVNKIRMDIEEDINKINERFNNGTETIDDILNYCKNYRFTFENGTKMRLVEKKHVDRLIDEHKKLLAEREQDKKRIKELEAKLEFKQWGDLDNLQFEEYMNSFIPKQRVKETIENIKERMEKEDIKGNCYNVHAVIYLLERIERMLLEDK